MLSLCQALLKRKLQIGVSLPPFARFHMWCVCMSSVLNHLLAQMETTLACEEQGYGNWPQSRADAAGAAEESRTLAAGTGEEKMGRGGAPNAQRTRSPATAASAIACGGGRSGGGGDLLAGCHGGVAAGNGHECPRRDWRPDRGAISGRRCLASLQNV